MRGLALALAIAGLLPAAAAAQGRQRPPVPDTQRQRPDTGAVRGDTTRDTTSVGRGRGLPRTPTRQFPAPDSVLTQLLARPGFQATRYAADSVQLLADEKEIRLAGHGLIEREGSTLEADTVRYVEATCAVHAAGSPKLFDAAGVLVGEGMEYDACNKTGIVGHATTDFQQGTGTWFLRGDLAVDNVEDRVYASGATITSCDLTEAHYHFSARQVKYVSKRLMVSRPAVLYVADVPVAWLPFVFQDVRKGRRSGVLPLQFGINDIVRFDTDYQRHIANVGYYWAISDYADAQVSMDWYAQRFTAINGRLRYRWLDRFLAGGFAWQELQEASGSSSRRLSWSHQQQFSLASQLTANIDYATSARVISNNAVDPILAVGTIDSRLNYQRRFSFGVLNIGGSRTQSLDKPQVTATLPSLSFTPNPIALTSWMLWQPTLSFTNSLQQNAGSGVPVVTLPGRADTLFTDSRSSQLAIASPFRVGRWDIQNSLSISDEWSNRRSEQVIIDPDDSSTVVRTTAETFQTGVDWTLGVGLPVLFQGSWNLAPGVQMVNTAGGPYWVRNQYTNGAFVSQGKRFQFSASLSPTFYGLFPGIGPYARIRHAFSPSFSWAMAPSADVPLEYATAVAQGRPPTTTRVPGRHTISMGLSQNFEAKLRPPPRAAADTAASTGEPPEGRKLRLLSLQSDAIGYDFEQAKEPGRTGWTTQTWGNTVSSDLIRGFSFRFAMDLWDGPVGQQSSSFSPYLTSVATGFGLGASTFATVGRLLGLSTGGVAVAAADSAADTLSTRNPTEAGRNLQQAFQRGPLATQYTTVDRLTPGRGGTSFQANLNFSLQRTRPLPGDTLQRLPSGSTNSMLSGNVTFSPTRHWTVSWQTSYNFTQGTFSDHVLRLDRDLHDWRATFTFVRSPNGNFLFNFFIALIDEPDLKFEYDQRNVR
jgi:hypothetical protein